MKFIGVTGGIGSGKSTVCQIFHEVFSIPVYNADLRAKKIMIENKHVKKDIKHVFGLDAYYKNGRLNKPYLSQKIFSNKDLLTKMNNIVHPAVHEDAKIWFKDQKEKNIPYALYEAALIIENGSQKYFDALVVVSCPEHIRINRVVKRDKKNRIEIENRIKNQLSEEVKLKYANYIIINDGNKLLLPQIFDVHNNILAI